MRKWKSGLHAKFSVQQSWERIESRQVATYRGGLPPRLNGRAGERDGVFTVIVGEKEHTCFLHFYWKCSLSKLLFFLFAFSWI